jgi:hypothetical protein
MLSKEGGCEFFEKNFFKYHRARSLEAPPSLSCHDATVITKYFRRAARLTKACPFLYIALNDLEVIFCKSFKKLQLAFKRNVVLKYLCIFIYNDRLFSRALLSLMSAFHCLVKRLNTFSRNLRSDQP